MRLFLNSKTAGFVNLKNECYSIQNLLNDNFPNSCKHNPERYTDEDFRNSMTLFARFGDDLEIKSGIAQLKKDIASNSVAEIIKSYDNELGDYMFIIGTKNRFCVIQISAFKFNFTDNRRNRFVRERSYETFSWTDIDEIRILSRDEMKQNDIRKQYRNPKIKFCIGDARDLASVKNAMYSVDYVFNAVALKQVLYYEFFR